VKSEGLIDLLSALELFNIAGDHKNEAFSLWGLMNCGSGTAEFVPVLEALQSLEALFCARGCATLQRRQERDEMTQKTQ
jgi:hypothetical protein